MIEFFLKYLINKKEYISFDIFDTLIEREVSDPTEIFYVVGKKVLGNQEAVHFYNVRISAERDARKTKKNGEVTLQDIYEKVSDSYPQEYKDLMREEIFWELQLCHPKLSIQPIWNYALHLGKRIYLISDMYLSRKEISDMLKKCKIVGFEDIYVSNEHSCNKITGELFKKVINEKQIDSKKMLHIGDSIKADYFGAHKVGVQAVLISRKGRVRNILRKKIESIRSKC